jgi:hypothetical protein
VGNANKRVHYAVQKAGIAPLGSTTYTVINGLQTFGTNTTFDPTVAFEMGASTAYEVIENVPSIEVTLEKLLDGYAPIYTLATQSPATDASLLGRSNAICSVASSIYPDTNLVATGMAQSNVIMSGLYVSQISYAVTIGDNARESVTLVGNNRLWTAAALTYTYITAPGGGSLQYGTDTPYSINGSGGINRREDVKFGSTTNESTSPVCVLPLSIPGASASGYNVQTNGGYAAHVQSWNISVNSNRTDINELGRRGEYFKYMQLPVEVTNAITVISVSGDMVSAVENGIYNTGGCGGNNLNDERIRLVMCEGLVVDCGSKNKLRSIAVGGGNTDGSNQELTFNYVGWNDFAVYHPKDPNYATTGFHL